MPPKKKAKKPVQRRAHPEPEVTPPEVEDDFPQFPDDSTLASIPRNEAWDSMASIASDFKGWLPARTVLKEIRAVRTRFIQLDRCTRVGGWPLERWITIHGPSNHGKTTLGLGTGGSFLENNHFFAFIDAERTTPMSWLDAMLGDWANSPGFVAMRPGSFEEAVDSIRDLCTRIADARAKGKLHPNTSAFILIDSMRKLVPKGILAKVQEGTNKGGIDGVGGRAAQLKAAYTAAWLDEVIPLLDDTGTTCAAIARETESTDGKVEVITVGSGKSLIYEAGLVLRVVRAGFIHETKDDWKTPIYGERHRVEVRKTKLSNKDERTPRAYFHSSNGRLVPAGFDRARDLLELGKEYDIVKAAGSWLSYGGKRWQSEHRAVDGLTKTPELLSELEQEIRAKFSPEDALPTVEDFAELEAEETKEQD